MFTPRVKRSLHRTIATVLTAAGVFVASPASAEIAVCTRALAEPGRPELAPMTCEITERTRGATVFVREVPPAQQLAAYLPYTAPIPGAWQPT